MQTVKVEAEQLPAPSAACGSTCHLCLSTDRRTSSVERVSYAYGLVTDWAPQAGARVCWECRARLERLLRFKVQATQALQLLESAQSLASGASFTSLGKHTITTYDDEVVYDADLHTEISLKPSKHTLGDFTIEITKQENLYEDEICDRDSTEDSADEIEIKYVPPAIKSDINTTATPKKARLKAKDTNNKRFKKKQVNSISNISENFTATDEELSSYREVALLKLKMHTFKCGTCIVGFQAEDGLNSHNETFHYETAGGHVCIVCECRFQSEEALAKHRASHLALYRCKYPGCDFVHALRTTVRKHFAIHAQGDDKCTNKTEIEHEHLLKKISAQRDSYECDYCGKAFMLRRKFIEHIKIHTLKCVCDTCGRMFSTNKYLKRHMLAHLDPSHRQHGCNICQKRFVSKHTLLIHTRSHTGERPFKCENCSRTFTCRKSLKAHMKVHLLTGEKESEFRAFECNICGKKLFSYANLQNHIAVHGRKPLHCNDCERIFTYPSQLEDHVRVVHRREKPHMCTTCGAKFSNNTLLDNHLRSHSNNRTYKCDECDLTFKYNSGLWMHKLIHKGEKPHQCTICGSKFTLKGNLKGHMKTHSNEKPFECNVCGRKFPWKRNLKNHFKTHSKEQQVVETHSNL